jgi:hypothetical protein
MSTSSATHTDPPSRPGTPSLADLAQAKGLTVAATIDTLPNDALFDGEGEVEEFLTFVAEQRRSALA